MKIVFLLIVVIAGKTEPGDELLFEDVFDCNKFALWTERQATSATRMNWEYQRDVTAYCLPKVVDNERMTIPSSHRTGAPGRDVENAREGNL